MMKDRHTVIVVILQLLISWVYTQNNGTLKSDALAEPEPKGTCINFLIFFDQKRN